MTKEREKCTNCGNDTFYVLRDTEDPIGTTEECTECGER